MPHVPSNFLGIDFRPVGASGTIPIVDPSGGNSYGIRWIRLGSTDIEDNFAINGLVLALGTQNNVATTGLSTTTLAFTASYNRTPSGAILRTAGTGDQVLADPYDSYVWGDFVASGIPNATRVISLHASGAYGSASTGITFRWFNQQRYGASTTGLPYSSSFIGALSGTRLAVSGHTAELAMNAATGSCYLFYAFRTAAGAPRFVDKASALAGGWVFATGSVSFPNSQGYTENYDIYRSENYGIGQRTILVEPS